jgi:hypothetical protein
MSSRQFVVKETRLYEVERSRMEEKKCDVISVHPCSNFMAFPRKGRWQL